MVTDQEVIAQLDADKARVAADEAAVAASHTQSPAPVPGDAVGQAPAESAPGAVAAIEAEQAVAQETPAEPPVAKAVETVATTALEALATAKATNPQGSFVEHLKEVGKQALAEVVNPADEAAVLAALITVVKEVVA